MKIAAYISGPSWKKYAIDSGSKDLGNSTTNGRQVSGPEKGGGLNPPGFVSWPIHSTSTHTPRARRLVGPADPRRSRKNSRENQNASDWPRKGPTCLAISGAGQRGAPNLYLYRHKYTPPCEHFQGLISPRLAGPGKIKPSIRPPKPGRL